MNLFEILSNDERIIVLSQWGDGVFITWNRSLTLQAWSQCATGYVEVDIRTLQDEPKGYAEARIAAQRWTEQS